MSDQRQDSPMVDEMFDGSAQMDVMMDAEDSMNVGGGVVAGQAGVNAGANAGSNNAAGRPITQANVLLQDLTSNERTVHSDFFNKFDRDLFDDKDLN